MSSSIPTVEIGPSGNKTRVPRIGLGCMGMSPVYGDVNDEESVKVLNHAIDSGCTLFDTAEIYGVGHNEKLISKVLAKRRNEVFLCTKFGITYDTPTPGEKLKRLDEYITGFNSKPEHIQKSVDGSLKRLGIDKIDLYYQHRVDPEVPIEEVAKTVGHLVKEGKVKYFGLSECTADQLRRAHKIYPVTAVEMEYSAWTTDIERNGILDACRELDIALVAYSPLGRGFLTGQIKKVDDISDDDWRRANPRFKKENLEKNLELVNLFEKIAEKKGIKPGQLALAWVLAQAPFIIVIPGTKRQKYLDENMASGQIKLSRDELSEIREAINKVPVHGSRY